MKTYDVKIVRRLTEWVEVNAKNPKEAKILAKKQNDNVIRVLKIKIYHEDIESL